MSYPVADHVRVCVTKNILREKSYVNIRVTRKVLSCGNHERVRVTKNILREKSYASQEKSYPVANHERVRVTKNILREKSYKS